MGRKDTAIVTWVNEHSVSYSYPLKDGCQRIQ